MISFELFKNLFDKLELGTEIEIYLDNDEQYMMVKNDKTFTLGKNKGGLISNYNNLEETPLKNEWNKIDDIIINFAFSIVDDKEKITEIYEIEL